MSKPFEKGQYLSGSSLETLVEFLKNECPQTRILTEDYTIEDLVHDIEEIQAGMWSDSIDAMGEDA